MRPHAYRRGRVAELPTRDLAVHLQVIAKLQEPLPGHGLVGRADLLDGDDVGAKGADRLHDLVIVGPPAGGGVGEQVEDVVRREEHGIRCGPRHARSVRHRGLRLGQLAQLAANSTATSSAICAVFSAAPLRRLSPQTNRSMAFGSSSARRTLPTQVGSVPTTSAGVGNSACSGSSFRTTTGASLSARCAPSLVTSRANTACTATECTVTTGTRTQVAETFRSGMPRIFLDSLRTLSSSDDQPSSLTEPAQGTTLSASGAGNGPKSPIAARRSPARWPSARDPAVLSIWAYSASIPAWPTPDAA